MATKDLSSLHFTILELRFDLPGELVVQTGTYQKEERQKDWEQAQFSQSHFV